MLCIQTFQMKKSNNRYEAQGQCHKIASVLYIYALLSALVYKCKNCRSQFGLRSAVCCSARNRIQGRGMSVCGVVGGPVGKFILGFIGGGMFMRLKVKYWGVRSVSFSGGFGWLTHLDQVDYSFFILFVRASISG
ncbi:hypothetical protein XENOCAPTIV_011822 [Xenoophorus captivus]|uniref:Transmembrane protein n=1 Tax=Xenoophorus captivus TaxID=1517983 RepID=A0ABV0RGX4_9TELE